MEYYKNINKINNVPIEEVTAYFIADNFEYPLNSSFICENMKYEITEYYYYTDKQGNNIEPEMERYYMETNNCLMVELNIDEIISYVIVHEENSKSTYTKKSNRTNNGRFEKSNKCAFRNELSPNLIYALHYLGLSIAQIAKLFSVSRTTIYSRLESCTPNI